MDGFNSEGMFLSSDGYDFHSGWAEKLMGGADSRVEGGRRSEWGGIATCGHTDMEDRGVFEFSLVKSPAR